MITSVPASSVQNKIRRGSHYKYMSLTARVLRPSLGHSSFLAIGHALPPSTLPHCISARTFIYTIPYSFHRSRMATASKIQLSLDTCGVFHVPGITQESAAKASEVLQENHEKHHIFFNQAGFHSKSYISIGSNSRAFFPLYLSPHGKTLLLPLVEKQYQRI